MHVLTYHPSNVRVGILPGMDSCCRYTFPLPSSTSTSAQFEHRLLVASIYRAFYLPGYGTQALAVYFWPYAGELTGVEVSVHIVIVLLDVVLGRSIRPTSLSPCR